MATIQLTPWQLPGTLGPILVDVRTTSPAASLPTVLIHHGFKGFKDWGFFPPFAERIARAGYHAVTLSVSGAGVDAAGQFVHPERFAENTYNRELADLRTVVNALRAGDLGLSPAKRLGLVGHSRGGGMALCLAHEEPAIVALATWAAISRVRRHDDLTLREWQARGTIEVPHARLGIRLPLNYVVAEDALAHETGRLDIAAAAAAMRRPWLLFHGTADESVPLAEGELLAERADPGILEAHFVPEATHTFGATQPWSGPTPHSTLLFDTTLRFFLRHLG